MPSLTLCAFVIVIANAAASEQQRPEYIEERIADSLKAGIDAAAGEITELRHGVRDLKEGAERKIAGAAEAVEKIGDNARNVALRAEQQVGSVVSDIKQGISNAYNGALHSVGQELVDVGRSLQRDGSQTQ